MIESILQAESQSNPEFEKNQQEQIELIELGELKLNNQVSDLTDEEKEIFKPLL